VEIIGKGLLEEFWQRQPQAQNPLRHWIDVVYDAHWNKWHDVKRTFNTAGLVHIGNIKYVIFNISGNKYRLVTAVNYIGQLVVIEIALTHEDYTKESWKNKL
jgi:mRNA interferase HigB